MNIRALLINCLLSCSPRQGRGASTFISPDEELLSRSYFNLHAVDFLPGCRWIIRVLSGVRWASGLPHWAILKTKPSFFFLTSFFSPILPSWSLCLPLVFKSLCVPWVFRSTGPLASGKLVFRCLRLQEFWSSGLLVFTHIILWFSWFSFSFLKLRNSWYWEALALGSLGLRSLRSWEVLIFRTPGLLSSWLLGYLDHGFHSQLPVLRATHTRTMNSESNNSS